MMAAQPPRPRAARELPRRKYELPAEFVRRPRILAFQGIGKLHARHAAGKVAIMELTAAL
jgi:hypothetical protein